MNLKQACERIAQQIDLDANELYEYAQSDDIGGYHTDGAQRKWDTGAIWGVEGQILYALVRATQPKLVVNLGVHHGCSVTHIAAALHDNGTGEVVALDRNGFDKKSLPKGLRKYVTVVRDEAVSWVVDEMPARRVDMVFEDLWHDREEIATVWTAAKDKVKKGALLINHDSEHHLVGAAVRAGIADAGLTDAHSYLIEPSDCGLSIWQNM